MLPARKSRKLFFFLMILLLLPSLCFANDLVIGVSPFVGCVENNDNEDYVGLEAELWKKVAADNDWTYSFKEYPFHNLLHAIRDGDVDVALAGISVTSMRLKDMDFSIPTYNSGLQLMVSTSKDTPSIFIMLTNSAILSLVWKFGIFIIIASVLLWAVERGQESGISDAPFPGLPESFWLVNTTVTTVGFGFIVAKTWQGRCVLMLLMYVGISWFGTFIAQVNALIDAEMEKQVISLDEMKGKKIATKKGTTSISVIKKHKATPVTYDSIDRAFLDVITGKVDGVLFDSPVVKRFAAENRDKVLVADKIYNPQYYSMALKKNSELRKRIDASLLKLMEDGTYKEIHDNWFD